MQNDRLRDSTREKWTIWDENEKIHVIFAVFRLFSIIQIMLRQA